MFPSVYSGEWASSSWRPARVSRDPMSSPATMSSWGYRPSAGNAFLLKGSPFDCERYGWTIGGRISGITNQAWLCPWEFIRPRGSRPSRPWNRWWLKVRWLMSAHHPWNGVDAVHLKVDNIRHHRRKQCATCFPSQLIHALPIGEFPFNKLIKFYPLQEIN